MVIMFGTTHTEVSIFLMLTTLFCVESNCVSDIYCVGTMGVDSNGEVMPLEFM